MVAGRRDVPLEVLEKAIRNYRFSPAFLFTGEGTPFLNAAEDDGLRLRPLSVITDQQGEERIVHVPYLAQAGYGSQLDDPVYVGSLPSYQLPDPQFRSGTYRSFEIAGSSMEPTFKPNDIVIAAFVEPRFWEQAIKSGQIYIVVTQTGVVIKRLNNQLKAFGTLECCSDNPEYERYLIPADEIREIWKARVKLTTWLDIPTSSVNAHDISQQLQVQQKMLENLHFQLTSAGVAHNH
jgi:phage repressor protein C with HTH and peptisase S24 domain